MRIYIIGFPGCGKSFLGRLLAKHLDIPFIDLDNKIIEQEKASINDIFARESGESYFRQIEKEVLESSIANYQQFVMATGGGTPCFHNNINLMNTTGITIFLDVAKPILYDRLLKENVHRPLIKDLSHLGLIDYINNTLIMRQPYYSQCTIKAQNDEDSLNELLVLIKSAYT